MAYIAFLKTILTHIKWTGMALITIDSGTHANANANTNNANDSNHTHTHECIEHYKKWMRGVWL